MSKAVGPLEKLAAEQNVPLRKIKLRLKLLRMLPLHRLENLSNNERNWDSTRPYLEYEVLADWTEETMNNIIDYVEGAT